MSQRDYSGWTNLSVLQAIIDRTFLNPSHPAAKDLHRELSYAELMEEVARIGTGLQVRGVNAGDRVGLLIPNSVDFIATALACLWIGAVFVPLAVTDPPSRLDTVTANCMPALIVNSRNVDAAPYTTLGDSKTVTIDLLREEGPAVQMGATNGMAYMIYTSGTTGAPKGVQIGNAAFSAAVHSTVTALGLSPVTRTLCVSPFHFDGSYANLFTTLVAGGTVVIRPRESLLYPQTFFNTVAQEKISYSGFTPSYLRLLLASRRISELNDSTLKTIALGGESPSVADLRSLWSVAPSMRVFNRYGPTEATISVTDVELTLDMVKDGTVTIGRPHPGVSFVLVDDVGGIVGEENQIGELHIGGVQLMSGYWADPVLTHEVMRSDVIPNEILYRTGDLAYRDVLNDYIYVGRTDRVVKRSGVRISLVELSASMNKIDGVESAVCLNFIHEGDLGIVAFVKVKNKISDAELRRLARALIPDNMLPDRIERVPTMPLNSSNQLDENLLLSTAGLRAYHPNTTKA